MDANEKRKTRWILFYNIIACAGIICLILPYFDLASYYLANIYSTAISVIVAPFLVFLGYFISKILMLCQKKRRNDISLEYSYDVEAKNTSKVTFVISVLTSGAISAIIGNIISNKMLLLLGPLKSNDLGAIIFTISCILVGILGCVLAKFKFYQILSIKTMPEYLSAFAFLFGCYLFFNVEATLLYTVCLVLFLLCLALCMNQENIVKIEYMHKTCFATNSMRWAGLKSVVALWLFSVTASIVSLSICSFFRMLLLLMRGQPLALILYEPFEGNYIVNIILLVFGGIFFFVALVLFPIFLISPHMSGIRMDTTRAVLKLKLFIISLIRKIFKIGNKKKPLKSDEINPIFYLDSIAYQPPKKHKAVYTKYKDFHRALKTISNINNQYMFAYRVLIESFFSKDIGLKMSQTPLEMADLIKEKTNFENIDILTAKYINIAYAEDYEQISESDIIEICNTMRDML